MSYEKKYSDRHGFNYRYRVQTVLLQKSDGKKLTTVPFATI